MFSSLIGRLYRNQSFLLLCIFLLSVFFRFYHLNFQSLWLDELYSMSSTHPSKTLAEIVEYCKKDQPPAYFIALHFWFYLLGYNEFSGRLFSALIGLVGVVVIYFLGKELGRSQTGLVAAFFASINFFLIYYSQEVRFYGFLFLFTSLSFLFFFRFLKNCLIQDFIFYSLCSVILLYTHYYSFLVLLAEFLIFLLYLLKYGPEMSRIFFAIVFATCCAISFIPWYPVVFNDLGIKDYWLKTPHPFFVFEYFYLYTGKEPLMALISLFLLGVLIKMHWNWKLTVDENDKKEAIHLDLIVPALFIFLVICYLIPYAYSLFKTPILHDRYTIITLPAWFSLIALGFSYLSNQKFKIFIVFSLCLSTFINLFLLNPHYLKIHKSQFREVSKEVVKEIEEGYLLYSDVENLYNFYLEQYQSRVKAVNPYQRDIEKELKDKKGLYILLAHTGLNESISQEQLQIIRRLFREKKKIEFHQASAILYTR